MESAEQLGVICKAHSISVTSERARAAHELIARAWEQMGIPPTHLAARGPGMSSKIGAYGRRVADLSRHGFDDCELLVLMRRDNEFDADAAFGFVNWEFARRERMSVLCCKLQAAGVEAHQWLRLNAGVMRILEPKYGYAFFAAWRQPRGSRSALVLPRQGMLEFAREEPTLWLHDILPYNYLNDEYLGAPVGFTGMSLRQWIEADPANRGMLSPCTPTLMEWRPPLERIPEIREELYRKGRMYFEIFNWDKDYWRGPKVEHQPNPLYRPDPRAPWEAPPDPPIPTRFRAATFAGLDPAITFDLDFPPGID